MRKLDAVQPTKKVGNVVAGDIANILYKTSNVKSHKNKKIEVKRKFQGELSCEEKTALINEFTDKELYTALKYVKNEKAVGVDGILPKFLKNLRPRSINWIIKLASKIADTVFFQDSDAKPKRWLF